MEIYGSYIYGAATIFSKDAMKSKFFHSHFKKVES